MFHVFALATQAHIQEHHDVWAQTQAMPHWAYIATHARWAYVISHFSYLPIAA
jgi:hypothetical protein